MIMQGSKSVLPFEITWVEISGAIGFAASGSLLAYLGALALGWRRRLLYWRLLGWHIASWALLVVSQSCYIGLYTHPSEGLWTIVIAGACAILLWFGSRWALQGDARMPSVLQVTLLAFVPPMTVCCGLALLLRR